MSGGDLVEAGLEGELVGKALARIRAGFLDGEIANREEALALAQELARRSARRGSAPKRRKSRRKVASRKAIADTSGDVDGGSARATD